MQYLLSIAEVRPSKRRLSITRPDSESRGFTSSASVTAMRRTFFGDEASSPCQAPSHQEVLGHALPQLLSRLPEGIDIAGVGHRVVHGGDQFIEPTRIDDEVAGAIDKLSDCFLTQPSELPASALVSCYQICFTWPFDTAFHATLPRRAYTYALPHEIATEKRLTLRISRHESRIRRSSRCEFSNPI